MRAQLDEEQARRLRLRPPVSDLGQPSNLLQQLQNSYFCGHTLSLNRVNAGHVPEILFSESKTPGLRQPKVLNHLHSRWRLIECIKMNAGRSATQQVLTLPGG